MARGSEREAQWRPPAGERWRTADGRRMLVALAASGDSDAAFARTHGIGLHRIRYWRSKLETGAASGAAPRFVPVRAISAAPTPAATAPGHAASRHVELELPGGARLRFVGTWDAAAIAPWLRAVEARS